MLIDLVKFAEEWVHIHMDAVQCIRVIVYTLLELIIVLVEVELVVMDNVASTIVLMDFILLLRLFMALQLVEQFME